jgi:hypothetical protein
MRQIFMDSLRTPPLSVETMQEVMRVSVAQQRFNMLLLSAFGLIALALGAAGLYGVMSYTVARQTKEIGVRMALGAQRGQILTMVLREASLLVVAGLVIGIAASIAGAQLLRGPRVRRCAGRSNGARIHVRRPASHRSVCRLVASKARGLYRTNAGPANRITARPLGIDLTTRLFV